jgi:hypothetical protein
MPRNSERSFCCGAGGARMWMEEKTGERINLNRTTEAVETGADQIAVGCPFCRVMLSDGLTALQAGGSARQEVEVLDVAQMLLASVKRVDAPATIATPPAQTEAVGTQAVETQAVETRAEPEEGDVTQTANTVTDPHDVGAAASPEPDPEVAVAGGEDDPAEKAAREDQPGADSEPGVNQPEPEVNEPAKRAGVPTPDDQGKLF